MPTFVFANYSANRINSIDQLPMLGTVSQFLFFLYVVGLYLAAVKLLGHFATWLTLDNFVNFHGALLR